MTQIHVCLQLWKRQYFVQNKLRTQQCISLKSLKLISSLTPESSIDVKGATGKSPGGAVLALTYLTMLKMKMHIRDGFYKDHTI